MQKVANKITAELKALIALKKSNNEITPDDGNDADHIWDDFNKRRPTVIETILFLQEELKPFEKEIIDLVNELEGRTDE